MQLTIKIQRMQQIWHVMLVVQRIMDDALQGHFHRQC